MFLSLLRRVFLYVISMQSIQDDSNELRMTCKYDTDGMVYRDYVQATKSQVDIMIAPHKPYTCVVVDTINVRGHSCSKCSVSMARLYPYAIHFTYGCDFSPIGYNACGGLGEDNFKFYARINPVHRCSPSPTATTQTWLGSSCCMGRVPACLPARLPAFDLKATIG